MREASRTARGVKDFLIVDGAEEMGKKIECSVSHSPLTSRGERGKVNVLTCAQGLHIVFPDVAF